MSSQAQADEIKTNQVVVLQIPGSPLKIIRANQVELKDIVFVTVDELNRSQRWQKSFLVGMVPLVDAKGIEDMTDVQIQEILSSYEKLTSDFPDTKKLLESESFKLRKLSEDRKRAASEKEALKKEAFEKIVNQPFEDAKNYLPEELDALITQAQIVAKDYPDLGEKIDSFLAPWLQRQSYLKENKTRFEGKWLTPQEVKEILEVRSEQEQEKLFKETTKLSFSSLVLPQASMLLILGTISLLLLSVFYSFFYLATERGGNLTFVGAIILLVGLGVLGCYGYYGFKALNFTTSANEYWAEAYKVAQPEDQVVNPLPRMLFLASGSQNRRIRPSDASVTFEDRQLNVLLKKYLKIQRSDQAQILDLERNKLLVRFYSDRVEFIDEVVCLGKQMLIRYEILYKTDGKVLSFYDQNIYVGGARLPSRLGAFLFRQFLRQLQESIKATNIATLYSIEKIEGGSVTLLWPIPTQKPRAKPQTQMPAPVPAVNEAPLPAETVKPTIKSE
ncbi:MAG: hypothetical protein SH807_02380 [Blastochloris sp.]|nr:hypothetical protein [Blastochloris sp.]